MGRLISKAAFKFSIDTLGEKCKLQDLFFWTFTFKEVLDVEEAKKRWRKFLAHRTRGLVPSFPEMSGIRTFEMHRGGKEGLSHGLHIHCVVDTFLPVDIVRLKWFSCAGKDSRIHVKKIAKEGAHYIGKYLNKQRDPCLANTRLWAAFGKLDATRCKDIEVTTSFTVAYKVLNAAIRGFSEIPWGMRIMFCNRFMAGSSIESLFAQAGMEDDQYEQAKAERDYFAGLNDSENAEWLEDDELPVGLE